MNELQNCSKCGNPMKFIPAGVSRKTNKPYSAFYKCDSCGAGYPAGIGQKTAYGATGQNRPIQPPHNAQLDRIEAVLDEIHQMLVAEAVKKADIPKF